MNFEIIEWNPGHFPIIQQSNDLQQMCFKNIQSEIRDGRYVDVGKNDSYLYSYGYYLYDFLLENKRHPTFYTTATALNYKPEIIDCFKNFINLYKESKPHVVKYSYPGLLFADIYFSIPTESLEQDFLSFLDLCEKNSFYEYGALLALFCRHIYNIKPETEIECYKYLPVFAQFSFKQYLTAIGIDGYDEILHNIENLARADYEKNKINFLYRLYDFYDGSLCGFASGHYISFFTSDYLNSEWNNSGMTERDIRKDHDLFIDHILVPNRNKEKITIYLETILREAENQYRMNKGLPRVGDGWISETLLFKQIEAAFPHENVEQHAHPYFLGKQHYDVYIPKHKIALEYQGEQHFKPIDFFGGKNAFKKNQERDTRKKDISKKNGVTLIEVLPGYQLHDLIYKILSCIENKNSPMFKIHLQDAIDRAGKIKSPNNNVQNKNSGEQIQKQLEKSIKEHQQTKDSNDILDKQIAYLVSIRTPSPFANIEEWKKPLETALLGSKEYNRAEKIRVNHPEEALTIYMNLIQNGIYNAPIVYGRVAQILRKQRRMKEELDFLLQMKRDYGYTNYDSRIRTLLKSYDINL